MSNIRLPQAVTSSSTGQYFRRAALLMLQFPDHRTREEAADFPNIYHNRLLQHEQLRPYRQKPGKPGQLSSLTSKFIPIISILIPMCKKIFLLQLKSNKSFISNIIMQLFLAFIIFQKIKKNPTFAIICVRKGPVLAKQITIMILYEKTVS